VWSHIKDYDIGVLEQLVSFGYFKPIFEWGYLMTDETQEYNNEKFRKAIKMMYVSC